MPSQTSTLLLEGQPLAIADVRAVAARRRQVQLTEDPRLDQRMEQSVSLVRGAVQRGERVYGVTTGFGSLAEVDVPGDQAANLQGNLLAFLAAGGGAILDRQHVRGAMLLRANMLLRGISGVRPEIVRRLVRFLTEDVVPIVRELGSIGASGDLIPLSIHCPRHHRSSRLVPRLVEGSRNGRRRCFAGPWFGAPGVAAQGGAGDYQRHDVFRRDRGQQRP